MHLEVPALRATRPPATTSLLDAMSPAEREDALHPADPSFDGRDTCGGEWLLAERHAEQRWWSRQLLELRREAHAA